MGARVMLPGWEATLARLTAPGPMEWDWSRCNCALWVADVVREITGRDFADEWRVLPGDGRSVVRQVANAGGLGACVTRSMGEPIDPLRAQRGDVVLHSDGKRDGLGVCTGRAIAYLSREGIRHRPVTDGVMAWSVR